MGLFQQIKRKVHDWMRPTRAPLPEKRYRVVNLTRSTVLAEFLEVANTSRTRRKGLLGRLLLSSGEGLWIIPCESVHTLFMRFSIDLVYLDCKRRIRKLRSNVVPWRLSACISAHSVLELPSGTIRVSHTEIGDLLELAPAIMSPVDPKHGS
ncbi:MAG: DUF192 domain-containing protein [Terracidiphilus sp.]|nr:DUF192 domain-containing protein [Terracidiphilus sp.]